jgi:hypothetical protein
MSENIISSHNRADISMKYSLLGVPMEPRGNKKGRGPFRNQKSKIVGYNLDQDVKKRA